MKVAFWSNVHGQTGVTSNVIALALMAAIEKKKVALLQSHFVLNNMSKPLVGTDINPEEFRDTGIDALIRDYKSRALSEDVIRTDAITVPNLNRRCDLYIGTGRQNEADYERELLTVFEDIYDSVDKFHNLSFIDVRSGYREVSQSILSCADVVVVCLNQNTHVIDRYFAKPVDATNVYYLFGNYDENSKFTLKNLQKKYPALRKRSAMIAHNAEFMDAQNDGQAVQFMLKNYNCAYGSANYEFVESLKTCLDKFGLLRKEES